MSEDETREPVDLCTLWNEHDPDVDPDTGERFCGRCEQPLAQRPSPAELWHQADVLGASSAWRDERYRQLLREHGHLIPGRPKPLPCGWSYAPDTSSASDTRQPATEEGKR
jgi:hypothetical protein